MTTPDLHDRYVRLVTRTGERTAMRGPTEHGRPLSTQAARESSAGGPVDSRPRRRRPRQGPVAGCVPERCWHVYPHWAWGQS